VAVFCKTRPQFKLQDLIDNLFSVRTSELLLLSVIQQLLMLDLSVNFQNFLSSNLRVFICNNSYIKLTNVSPN
jgi:hypothetical protein